MPVVKSTWSAWIIKKHVFDENIFLSEVLNLHVIKS